MSRLKLFWILLCILLLDQQLCSSTLWAKSTPEGDVVFEATPWERDGRAIAPSLEDVALADFPSSGSEREVGYVNTARDTLDGQIDGSTDRLIDRVTDPISWLMNFRFRESWNWPVGENAADTEEFQFRPTIPFKAWGHVNILRVTVPYTVSGPENGLGDVQLLDLVVHEEDWGRWGVGPVVRLTSEVGSEHDAFQTGPAGGAVSKNKHWTVGFLTQNFFAVGVAESRIQPILAYKFDDTKAVSVGEFEFRYDWENAEWKQLPLGVQFDYILDVHHQKMQFFVNPQYNFEREANNSGWTLFIGVSLLVPEFSQL